MYIPPPNKTTLTHRLHRGLILPFFQGTSDTWHMPSTRILTQQYILHKEGTHD